MLTRTSLIVLSCFILFSSCKENRVESLSFYHWTTSSSLTNEEMQVLKDLNVTKLYYRYFDVDGDRPVGVLTKASDNPYEGEIIPCVFITNGTFKRKSTDEELQVLASNILRKIGEMHPYLTDQPLTEVQFDCDWTASTRERFFTFLILAQESNPKLSISSTIRLHQLTSPESVPPVKTGTLMVYNTSNLTNIASGLNSILDIGEVKKYIKHLSNYPIPLDIALPAYSWCIVNSDGYFFLKEGFSYDMLDSLGFSDQLRQQADGTYVVEESIYFETDQGYNGLSQGAICKFEEPSLELLQETLELVKHHANNRSMELILYHLNSPLIQEFSAPGIKTLLNDNN